MTPSAKLSEKALVLAVVAFVAWTPPMIGVFSTDGTVFGLPVLFVYFFLGWAVLIGLGAWAAKRLCKVAGSSVSSSTARRHRTGEG